jgi:serine/threonine protein kinase
MSSTASYESFDTKIPGGGSQFQLARVDSKDSEGKSHIDLLCLGAGSSALTMEGVQIVAGERRPVAIKQIILDKRQLEMIGATEMRGLEALAGRAHEKIVRFFQSFQGDAGGGRIVLSLVFERCPTAMPFRIPAELSTKSFCLPSPGASQPDQYGCDLYSNPFKRAPFNMREAVYVIEQVLRAVAHLHAATPPVIHRDVKPENVLIWGSTVDSATGDVLLDVKLTDYGTMRRMDSRDLTVGTGTRSFMASEVDTKSGENVKTRRPIGSYDASADIFSSGATLFFLVTAESPSGDTRKTWQSRLGAHTFVTAADSKAWYKAHPLLYEAAKTLAAAETVARGVAGGAGGGVDPAAAGRTAVPSVSTLDFYFPPTSSQRFLLEHLVSDDSSLRFNAAEALAWIAKSDLVKKNRC